MTELDIAAWAVLNWKTVVSFIVMILWVGKKHWDLNQLRKEFDYRMKELDSFIADTNKIANSVSNLKLELTMSREQQTNSITKIENLVIGILKRSS